MEVSHQDIGQVTPPILFLVFNRPELTLRSFEAIRAARPSQLYIAVDGPRSGRVGERELCSVVRQVVNRVDWPCHVATLFRDVNLGCARAVREAIGWFFQNVESGIILEDDCLAAKDFFRFCGEMLETYSGEPRVMCITGNNFQDGIQRGRESFYFSRYPHIWGWATWARAWRLYDAELRCWAQVRETNWLRSFLSRAEAEFWSRRFDQVSSGETDTWDFAWVFTCFYHQGLTVTPQQNLVTNMGFGPEATHTTDAASALALVPTGVLKYPLRFPDRIVRNDRADKYVARDWKVRRTGRCLFLLRMFSQFTEQ